ncbi:MAG: energy transducer TonB [Gemmatimonadales bacterium]|jgi:protein TonB
MFDTLIESRPHKGGAGNWKTGFMSVALHAAIISAAVYATLQAGESVEEVRQVDVTLQVQQQKKQDQQKQEAAPPPPQMKGFQTLAIPTNIPVNIPPPSTQEFNAADFSGVGVEGGIARGQTEERQTVIRQDQPYLEAVVEERPERISSPPVRYPDILRQAGIEGRVLLELVIDTSGHAERGSIRVLSSTHQLFEGPAREVAQASLFSPGRIQGRAVRVRVQLPINFSISRAGGQNP